MKHDFSQIKTHTIRGKLFRLVWRRPRGVASNGHCFVGQCDSPETKRKELWLSPKQDPKELLATVLHECFHASVFLAEEKVAEEFERDTMRLLNRMGLEVDFK